MHRYAHLWPQRTFSDFYATGQLGLLNLGQTCFLNVILQSFLANPLLKSYFLSDMHNHKMCKIKECMCCELDKLFIEVSHRQSFAPRTLNVLVPVLAALGSGHTFWPHITSRYDMESFL